MYNNISFEIEKKLLAEGYKTIAGIDEAGRGALAGPLVVGLVIFNQSFIQHSPIEIISKIRDSKQLTPSRRISALSLLKESALCIETAVVSHDIIDRINVNNATLYAVTELIQKAVPPPDVIIMDGNFKFDVGMPFFPIIKGDSKSITIASGSIAAKVTRDMLMDEYESIYSGYFFRKNKGYGTSEHINAINRIGPCRIHRKSYEPVKSLFQ